MRALVTALVLLCAAVTANAEGETGLAPNGTLRVALLLANPVLVKQKPDGTLTGVAVDLGRRLAEKLGARFQEVRYLNTETFAKSFGTQEWDVAIGPITPIAEKTADLSAPFMLVENIYLAAPGKQFASAAEVDRPGIRIAVVVNGAPDQYLSKTLKAASLVRIAGATPEIVEALRTGKADAYGSNAENVQAAAYALPGSKIVPGAFRTVSMAVAFPKGKPPAAKQTVESFVKEAKTSGLVQKSIAAAGLKGVRVAD